jgi:hypothetical protein
MPRQNKKTRIRGLPPRVLLGIKGDKGGSLPTISRIASDGRTGKYPVFFDDLNSIPFFAEDGNEQVILGANVPNSLTSSLAYQELGADIITGLSSSLGARSVKGVVDEFVSIVSPRQPLGAFRDHHQPAAMGKSREIVEEPTLDLTNIFTMFPHLEAVQKNKLTRFFATGSRPEEFGEFLDEPVWAKTKIEIDLTPAEAHSFYVYGDEGTPTDNQNYPMAYWNKETKRFEGVGSGINFGDYYQTIFGSGGTPKREKVLRAMLDNLPIGFGKSMDAGASFELLEFDSTRYNITQFARPTTTFGFPYHEKFHASSSNMISMCDLIDRPFLFEKAVLEVSCGCNLNQSISNRPPEYGTLTNIATFFILNQRGPFNREIKQTVSAIEDHSSQTDGPTLFDYNVGFSIPSSSLRKSDSRDLLTYMQIAAINLFTEIRPAYTSIFDYQPELVFEYLKETMVGREGFVVVDEALMPNESIWRGNFTMAATAKSLYGVDNYSMFHVAAGGNTDPAGVLTSGVRTFVKTKINAFGRNGFDISNGRNYVNPYGNPGISSSIDNALVPGDTFVLPISHSKDNPYLLLPTDNLILGWQVPLDLGLDSMIFVNSGSENVYAGKGPELSFPAAPARLTLYGSILVEGKEKHDTLNQLLTSINVGEAIEGADSITNRSISEEDET